MKYVKKGDPAPTADQLAAIKADAIAQLDRYGAMGSSRPTDGGGAVATQLHRLVLVFHGGECLLAEEV